MLASVTTVRPPMRTHEIVTRAERAFPSWHYSMMNDTARNNALEEAIANLDLQGKTVFEIGTGAGLAALFFARCGAERVITCESDNQLAAIAKINIERSGFDNIVTLVASTSTEYIACGGCSVTPDVIFTETLDCGVIGEGYDQVARDIRAIASNQTVILPGSITQLGFLIQSNEILALNRVESCSGFDVSAINGYSTATYYPVRYKEHSAQSLSKTVELARYDYLHDGRDENAALVECYRSGICHGVLTYFHAMYGMSVVTNDIRDASHWHQAFHPLAEPMRVDAGRVYHLTMLRSGKATLAAAGETK